MGRCLAAQERSNLAIFPEGPTVAAGLSAPGAWLVLQNEIREEINVLGARKMRQAGGKVLLNAAPARATSPELLELVDVLVLNAMEAEMLAGTSVVETLSGALAAADALLDKCASVVVTAGGEGVAYAKRVGKRFSIPAIPVKVASTHGAGDEFIGWLAASLANGQTTEVALAVANTAAAKLVSTPEADRTTSGMPSAH